MMFDQAARNRKPKPESALTAVQGRFHLTKHFENGLERIPRQPDASILNSQHGLAILLTHNHSNRHLKR